MSSEKHTKPNKQSNTHVASNKNNHNGDHERKKEQQVEQEDFVETLSRIMKSKITHILAILLVLGVLMNVAYDVRSGAVDYESSWTCEVKKTFDESVTCSIKDRIRQSLYQQIQQGILDQLRQQYPNAQNQQFLQQELMNRFQKIVDTNTFQGQDLDHIVEVQHQNYKENFQSDIGQTYFTAIDPYFYLGLSSNYYKNGHPGTTLNENGTPIVEYRRAPEGSPKGSISMHPFVMSQLYALNDLDPQTATNDEKMQATFALPAILAMLTIIPLFFVLRSTTNISFAIIGSVALTTLGIYVNRTQAGFVDTDGYIIFFAVLITTTLYYAFKTKALWKRLSLAGLSGALILLFQWAWGNSWFFITFTLAAILLVIGYESSSTIKKLIVSRISKDEKNKLTMSQVFKFSYIRDNIPTLLIGGVYFITVELLNIIIHQREIFMLLYERFNSSISDLTTSATGNIWPNVLSSVAELQTTNIDKILSQLIQQVNSSLTIFIIILSLLGIFSYINSKIDYKNLFSNSQPLVIQLGLNTLYATFLYLLMIHLQSISVNSPAFYSIALVLPIFILLGLYSFTKDESDTIINTNEIFFISLLLIWFAGGIFMSLNGVRFILLLGPAFALLITYGLYKIIEGVVKLLQLEFNNMNTLTAQSVLSVLVLFISLLVLSPQINTAYAQTSSNMPNFDDNWFELMDFVQENTSEDTIINSWWDFGHFYAAIGNRGVTFDGGSQGTPASYWTGNWLLTSDETRATNILQMLSCSLNQGFEYSNSIIDDKTGGVKSFHLIDSLMNLDSEDEIREYLKNYSKHDFTEEQMNELLSLIQCSDPRPMSVITSGDMVQKSGVWAHWGSWNATQKYILDNYNKLSIEEISNNLNVEKSTVEKSVNELISIDDRANNFDISRNDLQNQWLAPYPSFVSQPIECGLENDIVNCQDQLFINLSDEDNITTRGQITNDFDVSRIIVPNETDFSKYEINDKEELDVVVIPNDNKAQVLIAQYPLGTSMFTKLFYFDGFGTSQFEELKRINTQTAGKVILWNTIFEEDTQQELEVDDISVETTTPQQQSSQPQQPEGQQQQPSSQEAVLDEITE